MYTAWLEADVIEHRTTDGNKLAPYSDMTDDDLLEYEKFTDEIKEDSRNTLRWILFFLAIAILSFTLGELPK